MAGDHSMASVGAQAQKPCGPPPAYVATASQNTRDSVPPALPATPAVMSSENFDISYQKTSDGKEMVMSHVLTHDPTSLSRYIRAQARNVPNPIIRIAGTHLDKTVPFAEKLVDFDFTLSMRYLYPYTWRRTKVVPHGWSTYRGIRTQSDSPPEIDLEASTPVPSLGDWCRNFCAAHWVPKEFTIAHEPKFYGSTEVFGAVKEVIRSSKYRGNLHVTWSIEHDDTIVTSDHWMTCLRTNPVVWWLCIIFQLWVLTWPLLWVLTRRWTVLTIEYPDRVFASADGIWPTMDEDLPSSVLDGVPFQGAKVRMNPQDWVNGLRLAIVRCALARKQNYRIDSAETDDRGRPWQPLGSFAEAAEWGVDKYYVQQ